MFRWNKFRLYQIPEAIAKQSKFYPQIQSSPYVIPSGGCCFGITELFMLSSHFGRRNQFFNAVAKLEDPDFLTLEGSESFVKLISLYQAPWENKKYLSNHQSQFKPNFQELRVADNTFFFNAKKPVVISPLTTFIWNEDELNKLLIMMMTYFSLMTFTVFIACQRHQIAIHYDVKEPALFWFDANHIIRDPLTLDDVLKIINKYKKNSMVSTSLAINIKDLSLAKSAAEKAISDQQWLCVTLKNKNISPYLLNNVNGFFYDLANSRDYLALRYALDYLNENREILPEEVFYKINSGEFTPLIAAIKQEDIDMVNLLLSYDFISCDPLDFSCMTPLDFAKKTKNKNLIEIIEDNIANELSCKKN